MADRKSRYSGANLKHPRLWLGPSELKRFQAAVAEDPDQCAWSTFYDKFVAPESTGR